jgi:hypothetical protein
VLAARRVGRDERVIVVPAPDGSAGAIDDAARELASIRAVLATAPLLLDDAGVVEALAETIREGVLALGRDDYAVVFCAGRDAARVVPRLVASTRLARPWRVVTAAPAPFGAWKLRWACARLASPAILAVSIAAGAELELAAAALAPRLVRTPALGTRPTYVRALVDMVRRGEKEAGWSPS